MSEFEAQERDVQGMPLDVTSGAEPGEANVTEVAVGSGAGEESTRVDVPETLPVLPLKNTVLYPYLLSPLLVNSPLAFVDAATEFNEQATICGHLGDLRSRDLIGMLMAHAGKLAKFGA